MPANRADEARCAQPHVSLETILGEVSRETARLAAQCTTIQGTISKMLDRVDHPDLGAEIHMLQDIDRIQQTLADVASILQLTRAHASGTEILKDDVGSVVRLESLRQRLGLSDRPPGESDGADPSDITWF